MRFIEFDVDFEECGEVEEVILHDMYGRHESIVLKRGAEYRKPTTLSQLEAENAALRELVTDMYKSMNISCQFSHAIPAGTMAHIKNRVIGLGIEVDG